MFKSRNSGNLLFEFKKNTGISIHSYFVFFPFLAIWLDDKNKIIEWKVVKPFTFRIKPKIKFRRLVEIPINGENRKIISLFVGKGKV